MKDGGEKLDPALGSWSVPAGGEGVTPLDRLGEKFMLERGQGRAGQGRASGHATAKCL